MKTRYIVQVLLPVLLVLAGGCGMISILGTEGGVSEKVESNFNLKLYKQSKVAVLVDQPGWLSSEHNLRYLLTEGIRSNIVRKVRFPEENIDDYSVIAKMRSSRADFDRLNPVEIGRELGSDFVIFVTITKYSLYELPEEGYYSGSMRFKFMVFDVKRDCMVFPGDEEGKLVRLNIDVETGGKSAASGRLISAASHCVVRDLYDCPKGQYKIIEEEVNYELTDW